MSLNKEKLRCLSRLFVRQCGAFSSKSKNGKVFQWLFNHRHCRGCSLQRENYLFDAVRCAFLLCFLSVVAVDDKLHWRTFSIVFAVHRVPFHSILVDSDFVCAAIFPRLVFLSLQFLIKLSHDNFPSSLLPFPVQNFSGSSIDTSL